MKLKLFSPLLILLFWVFSFPVYASSTICGFVLSATSSIYMSQAGSALVQCPVGEGSVIGSTCSICAACPGWSFPCGSGGTTVSNAFIQSGKYHAPGNYSPITTCPAGSFPDSTNTCRVYTPPTCGAHQYLTGTAPNQYCQDDPIPTCQVHEHVENWACVADAPPVCQAHEHVENWLCVVDPLPVCSDGYHLEGYTCIVNPSVDTTPLCTSLSCPGDNGSACKDSNGTPSSLLCPVSPPPPVDTTPLCTSLSCPGDNGSVCKDSNGTPSSLLCPASPPPPVDPPPAPTPTPLVCADTDPHSHNDAIDSCVCNTDYHYDLSSTPMMCVPNTVAPPPVEPPPMPPTLPAPDPGQGLPQPQCSGLSCSGQDQACFNQDSTTGIIPACTGSSGGSGGDTGGGGTGGGTGGGAGGGTSGGGGGTGGSPTDWNPNTTGVKPDGTPCFLGGVTCVQITTCGGDGQSQGEVCYNADCPPGQYDTMPGVPGAQCGIIPPPIPPVTPTPDPTPTPNPTPTPDPAPGGSGGGGGGSGSCTGLECPQGFNGTAPDTFTAPSSGTGQGDGIATLRNAVCPANSEGCSKMSNCDLGRCTPSERLDKMRDLFSVHVDNPSGLCPPIVMDLSAAKLGSHSSTLHCDLLERVRGSIEQIMHIVIIISFIFIVASA